MRVLGIDPGTVTMGYGVVDEVDETLTVAEYGAITAPSRSPIGERLCFMYERLLKIISSKRPDVMAVEQPFVAKNARSALAIGRSQAVAILAAAIQRVPVYEYTPAQIKQRVSNFGGSSKEQIQEMVKLQLNMRELAEPADASDALAVALCHLSETRFSRIVAGGVDEG
jgi:crossover junction endodeoxyribonuclease RuvC